MSDARPPSRSDPVAAGEAAPDFTLPSGPGETLSLGELRGRPAVLAFYPGDWSPVCSDQLDLYQAVLPRFENRGARLVGISVDSVWCHTAFAKDRGLDFPLLADFDPKGAVARAYGVYREEDGVAERALFVLDAEGTVRWSHVSPPDVVPGADGILEALDDLAEGAGAEGETATVAPGATDGAAGPASLGDGVGAAAAAPTARGAGGSDRRAMRTVMDRARSGAPAAGRAVRDIFSTDEIFQRVVATADEEFRRSNRLLFLSGLAAGLTLALSFLGTAALTAAVPGENARAVGNLMYPVGFLLVLMGRYQLFTENTLTPVTLVLTRIASIPALLRVWGVVLAANVAGAAVAAYGFARTGIFSPATAEVAAGFGEHVLALPWWDLFWKGVIAGWLVASIVWLNHAARDTVSRVVIVFSIIYLLVAADLAHCVVGACEVLYAVFEGRAGFGAFAWDFFAPVTLGNTVGGVLLVAILNFSQTRNERITDRDCSALELPWRDWCFGLRTGRPDRPPRAPGRSAG